MRHPTFILFISLIVAWFLWRKHSFYRRRKKLIEEPFCDAWEKILKKNVKVYNRLPDNLKHQLHQKIKFFIDEKVFEGLNGLEINDEIKVTIAAQACILLLNRRTKLFPKCTSILVYPGTYLVRRETREGHIIASDKTAICGESWTYGPVVLTWDNVKKGARYMNDGSNLVFHEFAHQLDQEDGRAEGYPLLEQHSHYIAWARHLGAGYKRLLAKIKKGEKAWPGDYAAKNPAEYFAVSTEVFFERPKILKKKLPMVYGELKKFYKVDPVEWFRDS